MTDSDLSDQVNFEKFPTMSFFTHDSTFGCEWPSVSESSLLVYKKAVLCALKGPTEPVLSDQTVYKNVLGRP